MLQLGVDMSYLVGWGGCCFFYGGGGGINKFPSEGRLTGHYISQNIYPASLPNIKVTRKERFIDIL